MQVNDAVAVAVVVAVVWRPNLLNLENVRFSFALPHKRQYQIHTITEYDFSAQP